MLLDPPLVCLSEDTDFFSSFGKIGSKKSEGNIFAPIF
jgi:hypothetical protein